MADKAAGGGAGVEVPQAERVVPRGGEGELACITPHSPRQRGALVLRNRPQRTVGRDDDVRDKVVVAVQDLFRVAVGRVVPGELPDDDGLVCEGKACRDKSAAVPTSRGASAPNADGQTGGAIARRVQENVPATAMLSWALCWASTQRCLLTACRAREHSPPR